MVKPRRYGAMMHCRALRKNGGTAKLLSRRRRGARHPMTKYLHAMIRVSSLEDSIAFTVSNLQ
jgi:hypothetical protein